MKAIEAVREILRGGTLRPGANKAGSLMSDVGHGKDCACEVCGRERSKRRRLRERYPV